MTVSDLLRSSKLASRLDTELIICHVLKLNRTELITRSQRELSKEEILKITNDIEQRSGGMPIAYLTGEKDFYNHTFAVRSGVLIPRPETELLVEAAIEFLRNKKGARVLDMGCGSGCVGLSIAAELPNTLLTAIDISTTATEVTIENAQAMGIQGRAEVIQTSVEAFMDTQKFDCIVANPPYIASDDLDVDLSVRKFEPAEALFAGDDGYKQISLWTKRASELLTEGGFWATEIGHTQADRTCKILETAGFKNIKITKDLSGKDRMISGVK